MFEIEELYSDESHNELNRHIVSGDIVGTGYGKLRNFYDLMDGLCSWEYCVPKHGKSIPNEHKGIKLGEFSFLNADERFETE